MFDLRLSAEEVYSLCALLATLVILLWLTANAIRLRRTQLSNGSEQRPPLGEESRVARLGWAAVIALGAVTIAWITALTPVLTVATAEVSALRTALTGNLSAGCCEALPETFEASAGAYVAAWVQAAGVTLAALAVVVLAVRRGKRVVTVAVEERRVQQSWAGD